MCVCGAQPVMLTLRKKCLRLSRLVILELSFVLFLALYTRNVNESFMQALTSRADADGYIILAMTDEGYVDMAINFYETSFRAHHIDNFLFVGVGHRTCEIMENIPCFYYADDQDEGKASTYGQPDFRRKLNIRTEMVLEALVANFTVINSDVDVAFLSNPVSEIKVIVQNSKCLYMKCPYMKCNFFIVLILFIRSVAVLTVKPLFCSYRPSPLFL